MRVTRDERLRTGSGGGDRGGIRRMQHANFAVPAQQLLARGVIHRFGKQYEPLTSELTDWLRARSAKVETPPESVAVMTELRDPTVG
jgi:hypothetical protein